MRLLLLLSLLSSCLLPHIHAATEQWQGSGGDWSGSVILSERWSGGVVPGPNDDVIIGVGAPSPFEVDFAVNTQFQSLTLAAGTKLSLNGITLNVMTLTIDYTQGVLNSPVTIDGGVLIIQQGWYMNSLKASSNPSFVLSGSTIKVQQGCNVVIGQSLTNNIPIQLGFDFRTVLGNSSSIVNYGDFRIMGNVPVVWNGASDMSSTFIQPMDAANANFIIQRTATMLDPNQDGARLLQANNMQFQILSGIVHLSADNTIWPNSTQPLPTMDLTNFTNTASMGMVIELPTSTGSGSGTTSSSWVLSYPAQLSCASPIRTVSVRSALQIYGASISCEASIFQLEAVVTLMTPAGVGQGQASSAGIIVWQGILISGAKEFNLNGNTLQISQMTTSFSFANTVSTVISNGMINVNQLWVIEDLNTQSSLNQLTFKGVSINVQQGARWQIGNYLSALAGPNAFSLMIELLSSGSVDSTITNRGIIQIVGNAPIQWSGNNDINTFYEQPLGATNAQLVLQRTNNVAGRDASNLLTISGMQFRVLDGVIMLQSDINHLTTSPPPNLSPSQFEEATTNGMIQTLPTLVSGSGRFILSYPARVLCSSFIMTAVVRGEMEIWGASFQCPSVAFSSTSKLHLRSPTGSAWSTAADSATPSASGTLAWNQTTVLSAGVVDANGYSWVLSQLITDFRVMGVTPSSTISNAQVIVLGSWTVNSYTTSTSGINYHKLTLDNTQVTVGTSSAAMSLGPQSPSTAPGAVAASAKPFLLASSSTDVNSASSGLTVYGTLYGYGTFLSAIGVPMKFLSGSAINLQSNAGSLHLWSNAVFGSTNGAVAKVTLAQGTVMTLEGALYQFPSFAKEGFGTIQCLSSAVLQKSPGLGVCSSTTSTIASTSFGTQQSNPTPAPGTGGNGGNGGSTDYPTGNPGTTGGNGPSQQPGGSTQQPGGPTQAGGSTQQPGGPTQAGGTPQPTQPGSTPQPTSGPTRNGTIIPSAAPLASGDAGLMITLSLTVLSLLFSPFFTI